MKKYCVSLLFITIGSTCFAQTSPGRDHFPFPRDLTMFSRLEVRNSQPDAKRPIFDYVAMSETERRVSFKTSVEKEKYGSSAKQLIKYFNGGSLIYFEVRGKDGSLIYDDQGGYAYPQLNKLTVAIDSTGLDKGILRLREKTEFGWIFRPRKQLTCAALVRNSQDEWSYLESKLISAVRLEKSDFESPTLCPEVFVGGQLNSIYTERARISIDRTSARADVAWGSPSDLNPMLLIAALDCLINPR